MVSCVLLKKNIKMTKKITKMPIDTEFSFWLYKNHLEEWYKLLELSKEYNDEQLTIPVVANCSTCKHQSVSKYVEPCYGCRDNDGYDNYEK